MNEQLFLELSDKVMSELERALELLDADIDFELKPGGVLEVEFSHGGKLIINRHSVAKEIWVAAKSGGYHFRWMEGAWLDTRDGVSLDARLNELLSAGAGEEICLSLT